jgi:N-acetylglucosamine-6-phosphate deacetylase
MMAGANERILIYNAHLFTPSGDWQPAWLLTEGSTIRMLASGKPPDFEPGLVTRRIDASGKVLLPGFIDLHVHGAMGHEVMDANPQGLREMARYYASHGVTSFLATTWTASQEAILGALEAVGQVMGRIPGGATILGTHLEGPYLNAHKTGAQDARLIRRANPLEARQFLDSGLVRLVALAPEFLENLWLIDECVRRGVTVAAGHTEAGLQEMTIAVEHGLSQVTHCYNAMRPLGHRDLGTVGAAMTLPQINTELIADNIHIHPAALKILVAVKQPARVILITDAIRGAGLPEGEYAIDERVVEIRAGVARLPDGTIAGSTLTMDRALQNIIAATGLPLQDAWPMSSLNPARAIHVSNRKGSLEAGKDADLVLLDPDFSVRLTMVEGEVAYEKNLNAG